MVFTMVVSATDKVSCAGKLFARAKLPAPRCSIFSLRVEPRRVVLEMHLFQLHGSDEDDVENPPH